MAQLDIREMDRRRAASAPAGIGFGISKQRYQVMYDNLLSAWAVVDTMALGRTLTRHKGEKEAHAAAWREEERWYKCSPEAEPRETTDA